MASTERFTCDQVVRAIQQARGNITQAARALGCAPQTVRNYVNRHPSVRAALEAQRQALIYQATSVLWDRLEAGDLGAAKFVLSCIGGWAERRALAGDATAPVVVRVVFEDRLI